MEITWTASGWIDIMNPCEKKLRELYSNTTPSTFVHCIKGDYRNTDPVPPPRMNGLDGYIVDRCYDENTDVTCFAFRFGNEQVIQR